MNGGIVPQEDEIEWLASLVNFKLSGFWGHPVNERQLYESVLYASVLLEFFPAAPIAEELRSFEYGDSRGICVNIRTRHPDPKISVPIVTAALSLEPDGLYTHWVARPQVGVPFFPDIYMLLRSVGDGLRYTNILSEAQPKPVITVIQARNALMTTVQHSCNIKPRM